MQKQIFVGENLETISNNVETFTRKSKLISPVFKKYLPESPEVTEVNGFEQCLQSLINSDDWDFDFTLPEQQELPLSCKSEPAILPTQSDDDKHSSDCSCITDTTGKMFLYCMNQDCISPGTHSASYKICDLNNIPTRQDLVSLL